MKKFKFSLEKILSLRQFNEKEAKLEMGRSVSALSEIENNLKYVAEESVKTAQGRFLQDGKNHHSDFRAADMYIKYLDQTKEKLLKQAAAAEMELEAKKDIWVEAKSEVKVMDNLKERRFNEYKKAHNGG